MGDNSRAERQCGRIRMFSDDCIEIGNACIKGRDGNKHRLIWKHQTGNVSGKIWLKCRIG